MDLEPWLHLLHVLPAVIWVGGGVTLSVIAIRARRSADPLVLRDFAGLLSYVGMRVFTPAVVIVLVSGVWLVAQSSEWSFTQLWVLLALGALVVAFLIGAIFLSRSALTLERVATGTQDSLPAADAALRRWLVGYGVVLVVLLFALWDMVFQPGLG
jgi:uncharacterized membrane protein